MLVSTKGRGAITNESGTCYGIETCDQTKGWVGCNAVEPTAEDCDGFDNDCNGLIDDGLSEGAQCANTSPGPTVGPGTNGGQDHANHHDHR